MPLRFGRHRGGGLYTPQPPATLLNPDYGPDLRDWMAQPTGVGTAAYNNGGKLYLPPRTYTGGVINCIARPAFLHAYDAALPNNGWLTLLPQNPPTIQADYSIVTDVLYDCSLTAGGASITDLNNGGALLFGDPDNLTGVGAFRTALCGIEFLNGPVVTAYGAQKLKFWYCKSSYPVAQLLIDYNALAAAYGLTAVHPIPVGNTPVGTKMKGLGSNGFTLRATGDPYRSTDICILGCDTSDIADDGINLVLSRYVRVHGYKTWKYSGGDEAGHQTEYHSDSIQWDGGEADTYVDYCMFGNHVELVAVRGDISWNGGPAGAVLHHIWQCDSPTAGSSLGDINNPDTAAHNTVYSSSIAQGGGYLPNYQGIGDYYKWFGNGWAHNDLDADIDAVLYHGPFSPVDSITAIPHTLTHEWPAGVVANSTHPPPNGQIPGRPDMPTVIGHVDNPANVWRANNPYASFVSYITTYAASDPTLGFN